MWAVAGCKYQDDVVVQDVVVVDDAVVVDDVDNDAVVVVGVGCSNCGQLLVVNIRMTFQIAASATFTISSR